MARALTKKTQKIQKVVKKIQPVVAASTRTSSKEGSVAMPMETPKGAYIEAVGRRKVATARVRIYQQGGDFIVNGQAAGQYFDEVIGASSLYTKALELVGLKNKVTVTALVKGSGIRSQLDAVIHGLARALIKQDINLRGILKAEGLLTRDDRMKETRKIGMGGKARRSRQSPKR
jgi:small subunit ribosomal protein S9